MKPRKHALFSGAMLLGLGLVIGLGSPAWAQTQEQPAAAKQDDKAKADLRAGQDLVKQKNPAQALAKLQAVLDNPAADQPTLAQARLAAGEALVALKQYDKVNPMVEPALGMGLSARDRNMAQRTLLRASLGAYDWLTRGNLEAFQARMDGILAQPKEAWPGQKLSALTEGAKLMQAAGFFPQAQAYYRQLLQVDGLKQATAISAYRGIAAAQLRERERAKAYETLKQIEKLEGLSALDRITLQFELYDAGGKESDLTAVLKIEGVTATQRADVHAKLAHRHREAYRFDAAAQAIDDLLAVNPSPTGGQRKEIIATIDNLVDIRQFDLALAITQKLVDAKLSGAGLREARQRLALIRLIRQDIPGAKAVLEKLAEDRTDGDVLQLTHQLQLAACRGLEEPASPRINGLIDEALAAHDKLAAPDKIRALWDAAKLFFLSRHYVATRALMHRADQFGNTAVKTYRVIGVDRAPMDVGGWLASGLLDKPGVVDTRFYPYSQQDAAALFAVDVRADRPFGTEYQHGTGPSPTRLAMAYDSQGWHIFIHSQEPRIKQIMSRGGEGGSSLEMFFTPGISGQPYYQWIARLAANETSVYDWGSPYPAYRTLKGKPDYFNIQSQAIEDGWGTAIFISWDAFYDQMPMLDGREQVWRFSMQRWDPSGSVTWGGRVHEMGRWGHIIFEKPSDRLLLEIKRELLAKAWWSYNNTLKQQAIYWAGLRGDKSFHDQVIAPMLEESAAIGKTLGDVSKLPADQVDKVFHEQMANWREVTYTIANKRQDYLRQRLVSED